MSLQSVFGFRRGLYFASVVLGLVALDQASKYVVLNYFPHTALYNTGAAFGIKLPLWLILVVFLSIGVVALRAWYKEPHHWARTFIPMGLILGGALSNLLDRAVHGAVIDFIDIRVWPVFNLADTALVIGAIGMVWYALGSTSSTSSSHDRSKGASSQKLKQSGS